MENGAGCKVVSCCLGLPLPCCQQGGKHKEALTSALHGLKHGTQLASNLMCSATRAQAGLLEQAFL
eukprot:1159808-Pelagomonas_calceolata.AAC.5